MARFIMNRRWTFILTVFAFVLVLSTQASSASADPFREYNPIESLPGVGVGGGGGGPLPQGAGDPDNPTPSGLKYQQRGSVRTGDAHLSSRAAGDSRIAGTVWMWRLSVMERVLRAYWIRL